MDFSNVTNDVAKQVSNAIGEVLRLDISPADKEIAITRIIRSVGVSYHSQLYGAASEIFDSAAIATAGLSNGDGQAARLANKIVRNYALGREVDPLVLAYYNSVLGQAQAEAFANAVSMQKVPTLDRRIVSETCKWCTAKSGTKTNPTGEDFARHRDCDCLFIVSGYNTRNGLLDNYVKRR